MVRILLGLLFAGTLAGLTHAAEEKGPFGGFKHDRDQPIDITANALEVRQAEQLAIFTGEVIAGQDTLRLTADRVEVVFDENAESDSETGAIKNLEAKGNVFLSNGAETAEGAWAKYDVENGIVKMGGSVILTQGGNAGSCQSLVINLNTGVAKMEGSGTERVSLSLVPRNTSGGAKAPQCTEEQRIAVEKLGSKCIPLERTN